MKNKEQFYIQLSEFNPDETLNQLIDAAIKAGYGRGYWEFLPLRFECDYNNATSVIIYSLICTK